MSLDIIDGLSAAKTLKTSLDGADHVPHHIVKGAVADNAAETENPIPVAGKAVTSASYAPAYTDGDRAVLPIDKTSGGLLTHGRALAATTDGVNAAGDVAHDAVDSGNPIKLGGRALNDVAAAAVSSSDRVAAWFDTLGRMTVRKAKDQVTGLSSAARTATTSSAALTYYAIKGLQIWLKVTAITATPSITLSVECQNPIDGTYMTLCTFAAVTTVSDNLYQIYPGLASSGNSFNGLVSRVFRITVTHADADSITYSVGLSIEQ